MTLTMQQIIEFLAEIPEHRIGTSDQQILQDLIQQAKQALLPPQQDLPNSLILFIHQDQCPLCDQRGTIQWDDPQVQHDGLITRAGVCSYLPCRSHFVVDFDPCNLQCYTDETLRFERGRCYTAYRAPARSN